MRKLVAMPALLLAACSTMAAEEPRTVGETPGYVCKSAGLDAFAGRAPTSETGSEILRKSGARTLRWVTPGMRVTMEFREDRITVWIGTDGKIERVNCG
jgi:Peptidase inhibitor I78 family